MPAPTGTPLVAQTAPPAAAAEPDVYLVGLGEFPGETLIRLEAFFEGKYGVSGAQPAEVFAQVLTQVAGERDGAAA